MNKENNWITGEVISKSLKSSKIWELWYTYVYTPKVYDLYDLHINFPDIFDCRILNWAKIHQRKQYLGLNYLSLLIRSNKCNYLSLPIGSNKYIV